MGSNHSSETESNKKNTRQTKQEKLQQINSSPYSNKNADLKKQLEQLKIDQMTEVAREAKDPLSDLNHSLKKEKEELEAKVNKMAEDIKKLTEKNQESVQPTAHQFQPAVQNYPSQANYLPQTIPPNYLSQTPAQTLYWQQQQSTNAQMLQLQQNARNYPSQPATAQQYPLHQANYTSQQATAQNYPFQQPTTPNFSSQQSPQMPTTLQSPRNQWPNPQLGGSNLYMSGPQQTQAAIRSNILGNNYTGAQRPISTPNISGIKPLMSQNINSPKQFNNYPRNKQNSEPHYNQSSNNNFQNNHKFNSQPPVNRPGGFDNKGGRDFNRTPNTSNNAPQNSKPALLKTPVVPQENQANQSQKSNNTPPAKSFGVQDRKTEDLKPVASHDNRANQFQGRQNEQSNPAKDRPLFLNTNQDRNSPRSRSQPRFPNKNDKSQKGQQQNTRLPDNEKSPEAHKQNPRVVNHGRHRGGRGKSGRRGSSTDRNKSKPSDNSSFSHERRTNFKKSSGRGSARGNRRRQSCSTDGGGPSSVSDNEETVSEGPSKSFAEQPPTRPTTKVSEKSSKIPDKPTVLENPTKELSEKSTTVTPTSLTDKSETSKKTENIEGTGKRKNKSGKSKKNKNKEEKGKTDGPASDVVSIENMPDSPKETKREPLSSTNLGEDNLLMKFIGMQIPTLLDAILLNIDLSQEVRGVIVMSDPAIINPYLESPKTLLDIVNFKIKYPNAKSMLF